MKDAFLQAQIWVSIFLVPAFTFSPLAGNLARGTELLRVLHLESTEPERVPQASVEDSNSSSMDKERMFEEILGLHEQLGLTDYQIRQIQQKKMDIQKKRILTEAELEVAKIDLDHTSNSFRASETELKAHAEKVQRLQNQLVGMELESWKFLRDILSPEQKARLERSHHSH